MVDHSVADHIEITTVVQVFVDSIAARENDAVEQNHVTDVQPANVGFLERSLESNHFGRGQRQVRHVLFVLKLMRSLIQPFDNAAIQIQNHAAPAVRPTHVSD